ncbi:MAG: hypothetical protein JWM28_4109 [Chitinophagaceae bacterium]|nr:hypothetical protein [Chitinophagaceae bacterium]
MNKDLQAILNIIQQSEHLSVDEKNTISKSLKDANKELEITSFKLDRTEEVKRTTAILLEETIEELEQKRKAVEAQNKKLEIETSLERVRTVAMGMRKAGDLLDICQTLFAELHTLGFGELRNAMINIFDNDLISFLNYDYSDDAGKTITTHYYDSHPVIKKQIEEIRSSHHAFSETVFSGKDLDDWRSFRKEKGEKDDPKMDDVRELFYYFYSIGTGAIGISTYRSITAEKLNVLKRFRNVFDLAYRRFIDIEQAEAQAREAKIEAALERARTQSMLMQHSNELNDTLQVFHQQLQLFGINSDFSFLWLPDEANDKHVFWATWAEEKNNSTILKSKALAYPLDRNEPYTAECLAVWKSGELVHTYKVPPAEVKNYFAAWEELLSGAEKLKAEFFPGGLDYVEAYMKYGCFGIVISRLLTEDEKQILRRFTVEFERAYTRFLDLQKAEAQTREAQIEAALEKVRGRAMAMHKSDELLDAGELLYRELSRLGIVSVTCGYVLMDDEEKIGWIYAASPADGTILPKPTGLPHSSKVMGSIKASWKRQERFHVVELDQQATIEHHTYLAKNSIDFLFTLEEFLSILPERAVLHSFNFKQGYLLVVGGVRLTSAQEEMVVRFTKVFEMTYRRFLDLQQAEAQAREAKIEAALEKVRSRTMAMQRSEELGEVATLLFKQVGELGIKAWSTGFNIWKEGNTSYIDWMSSPLGGFLEPYTLDLTTHSVFKEISEARKRGEDFFVSDIEGEQLVETYELLSSYGDKEQFKKILESGFQFPTRQINHYVFGAQVSLLFITYKPCPEAWDVFKRFGKVFEQTYTRFLDLKRAEAQARESQIETALERVRSRSMAMQKSDELRDVIQVIYEQLVQLGFKNYNAGFVMDYRESDDWNLWMADTYLAYPANVHIPYLDHPQANAFKEAKEKGFDFYTSRLTFDEKNRWFKLIFEYLPGMTEEIKEALLDGPGLTTSCVFMKNVALFILNLAGIPFSDSENVILKRFGKVFEQTYTRFNDLKQAEAQAREAVKQASVDRIRAEIASMRTTNDLERIQPLIWNELTTLGVPFTRCGVFIMDEEHEQVHTFLSTPEGKAIATLHVPFEFNLSIITNGVLYWGKKKIYKEHWDAAAFTKAWIKLSSLRETSIDSPQAEHPPESLYLQLLPFLQGMLYVGSDAPLNDEELQLVQNLADAFSTAYARYEDFNKLESAKAQIEKTLVDLKQAQAQLVQAEKMASLGELTAGIAHEIQNPLNFVNNFSEVNKELLAELNEEIEKGNYAEVKNIAKDVAGNEEKISHHGKRADAIVKGMLQHSRSSNATKEPTDINKLADEYLRLAYHGLRAKDKSFNTTLKTDYDETIGNIYIIPQDIGRVVLNLINNAFYTVNEKNVSTLRQAQGLATKEQKYDPTVSISTKKVGDTVEISVKDNGNGIPQKVVDKIFQPFFTTKPTGQGTGLGLSLAYDIVKSHGGELKVETKGGESAEFIICLPA